MDKYNIALIVPSDEITPPPKYGGTERIADTLQNQLVADGHTVTLCASGDSTPAEGERGKLFACSPQAIRTSEHAHDPAMRHKLNTEALTNAAEHIAANNDYDIIHNHAGWSFLHLIEGVDTPCLTTLHGSLTVPIDFENYSNHPGPYVSISNSQRQDAPDLNYLGTVYNGIPVEDFPVKTQPTKDGHLLFIGRVSPEKGTKEAIVIALETGNKLHIAAKIDPADREYYETQIAPLLKKYPDQIIYIGEVDHKQKVQQLLGATALLMPNTLATSNDPSGGQKWREAFGITAVEANVTGTPVIAANHGGMTETVAHERTGFLCNTLDEMIARVEDVKNISPQACRKRVEQMFSAQTMTAGYVALYGQMLGRV
jgi:glycosyltransferase involved in cell wall biosynthesis